MCSPLLPPLHPRRLPTVADVIAESPSVHSCGPLTVAWRLVAPLTLADLGPFLALAVAVGCLCRAVADLTGDELEPPGAPSLSDFTGDERAPSLSDFTGDERAPSLSDFTGDERAPSLSDFTGDERAPSLSDFTGDERAPSLSDFTGDERAPSLSDFTGDELEPPGGSSVH